jgi:hypothetical protein
MALEPGPYGSVTDWWQSLADDPVADALAIASAQGVPAPGPITTPLPPEIEMPAENARPTIGFPRPVESAEIEMAGTDFAAERAATQAQQASMPSAPPMLGQSQPGLSVPISVVDSLPPMPDHEQFVDARVAGSERLSDDPLRMPTPEEAVAARVDGSEALSDPRDAYETRLDAETDRLASQDPFQAAQERLDISEAARQRSAAAELKAATAEAEDAMSAQRALVEARQRTTHERRQIDAEAKDLANQKIGAGDWYEEGGIGRTVSAMLLGFAGGLVQHLNGGRNIGLEAVNRSIDQFIAARQQDRAHQREMLGERRRSLGEEQAEADKDYHNAQVIRKAAYERAIRQIEVEQQNYDPEGTQAVARDDLRRRLIAQAAANEEAGALAREKQWTDRLKLTFDVEKNQRERDEARRKQAEHDLKLQGMRAKLGGGPAKVKPEDIVFPPEYYTQRGLVAPPVPMSEKQHKAWLPQKKASQEISANESGMSKEERENSIPGIKNPDGSTFVAVGRPEDISKARDQISAAKLIIRRMDEALRTRTGWSSDAGNSDERKRLQAQWGNVKVDAKNLLDLGAITASDVPLIEGVVGTDDPSSWKDPEAGIIEARRLIEDRIDTKLRGLNYQGERWGIQTPSLKKPEKSSDDLAFERAQDPEVGSLTSYGRDMQDERDPSKRASFDDVKATYKSGTGIPPGIQSTIDKWGAAARSGDEAEQKLARERLISLVNTGGNDAVKAAARTALENANLASDEVAAPQQSVARETAPPPPRKGKR